MSKTPRPLFAHHSFEMIYRQLALPLTKFLIKRLGGDQKAVEEVFSQTIVAAWKGLTTFEHKSSYFTWICKIALNKMADYCSDQINHRSRVVVPTLETLANFKDPSLTPEEKYLLEELRESVRDCLGLLPDDKRQLLYLRYWKEMTMKGIAQTFSISERAAEGKVYRAKLAFKEVLSTKYPHLKTDY